MNIVICGGGVIGASVAYFLAERGIAATLVEREDVACAASGKSGGFIARDWCDGQPQAELARASFDLHAELARTLDADYGYRRIDTLLVAGSDRGGLRTVSRHGLAGLAGRTLRGPLRHRLAPHHRDHPSRAIHPCPGRRRVPAWRAACARHRGGHRPRRGRRGARSAGRRHGDRRRCRRHRHGAVVHPRRAMAAASAGGRAQGLQRGARTARSGFLRRRCSSSTRARRASGPHPKSSPGRMARCGPAACPPTTRCRSTRPT